MKFYLPERSDGKLLVLCRSDECTCVGGKELSKKFDTNLILFKEIAQWLAYCVHCNTVMCFYCTFWYFAYVIK